MTTQTRQSTEYRYALVHGDEADFVAYQLRRDDGAWQTFSQWMVPPAAAAAARPRT